MPESFPGVQTKRDSFLIDIDLDKFRKRINDYFNSEITHEVLAQHYPVAMKSSTGFIERSARKIREALLTRGGPDQAGFVRFVYRPFDIRWLYWDAGRGLLGRPSTDYPPQVFDGNLFIEAREREAKEDFSRGTLIRGLADNFGNGFSNFFPMLLCDHGNNGNSVRRANLSGTAQNYLQHIRANAEDLFYYVIATLHAPAYRVANAGALRMGWPRIPLPGWPDGNDAKASDVLTSSATRGRKLAALFDPETPVPGITTGTLHPEFTVLAVPATADGRNMTEKDFELTAGWGHYGTGKAVMPDQGYIVEREYTPDERAILGAAIPTLGEKTFPDKCRE